MHWHGTRMQGVLAKQPLSDFAGQMACGRSSLLHNMTAGGSAGNSKYN